MKFIKKQNSSEIIVDLKLKQCIIDSTQDFEAFDCGNSSLNKYMTECVKGNHAALHGLYDVTDGINKLAGVCFLKCSAYIEKGKINYNEDGELDENDPIDCDIFPAIEILYFAIDKDYQDLKIADEENTKGCLSSYYLALMMIDIIDSSESFSKVDYILLYSVDTANDFYEKSGFMLFEDTALTFNNEKRQTCTPMYYPI